MSTQKQRRSRSKRGMRRSHLRLFRTALAKCSKCGEVILPHTMCSVCGHYRDKMVLDVVAKLSKKERKKKEKELKEKEAAVGKEKKEEPRPLSVENLSKKE